MLQSEREKMGFSSNNFWMFIYTLRYVPLHLKFKKIFMVIDTIWCTRSLKICFLKIIVDIQIKKVNVPTLPFDGKGGKTV